MAKKKAVPHTVVNAMRDRFHETRKDIGHLMNSARSSIKEADSARKRIHDYMIELRDMGLWLEENKEAVGIGDDFSGEVRPLVKQARELGIVLE